MRAIASSSHTDAVTDATVMAAPTSAEGTRLIRRCRLTVTGSLRVQVKVESDSIPFIDNDFDDGGGVSEGYPDGIPVPVGKKVTVTTTGTGTTRIVLLGD